MKLFCISDNPDIITSADQDLNIEGFKKVLTKIAVKDVTPYDQPIKLIKDFNQFCSLFIFPFIVFTSQGKGK